MLTAEGWRVSRKIREKNEWRGEEEIEINK